MTRQGVVVAELTEEDLPFLLELRNLKAMESGRERGTRASAVEVRGRASERVQPTALSVVLLRLVVGKVGSASSCFGLTPGFT